MKLNAHIGLYNGKNIFKDDTERAHIWSPGGARELA